MKILGIESSCDETAAAIVEDGRTIISNVVATQIPFHQEFNGVVPEIASRKHAEWIMPVVQQALQEANLTLDEIDGIAAEYGAVNTVLRKGGKYYGYNTDAYGFLKGLEFSEEPLPNLKKLYENFSSGYISVPSFGAGPHPRLPPGHRYRWCTA